MAIRGFAHDLQMRKTPQARGDASPNHRMIICQQDLDYSIRFAFRAGSLDVAA
jgi:hypothetical protein